jgi:ketosteroid isomerase-like protein
MNIDRRNLALGASALGLLAATPAFALTADEEAVAKKLEAFRTAQMAKDCKALEALVMPELSYSHSNGLVQDKDEFLKGATDTKTKFLSLEYQEPWIKVVGDVAIVRFHWVAESETVADGKKSSTNLHILMTWAQRGGDWKLLNRGSTKL